MGKDIDSDRIAKLRPIDDICFGYLADQPGVCEEMLQTILEDKALRVVSVTPQRTLENLYGRSVRLDALCHLGTGEIVNIEIQRSDNDNHVKRVFFNAASIVTKKSETGTKFEQVPKVIVVYISEFDPFGAGLCKYHMHLLVSETERTFDNVFEAIFVNTKNKDNSDTSALMSCFLETNINSDKFPKLQKAFKNLKHTKKGVSYMMSVMQEVRQEGETEGKRSQAVQSAKIMIAKGYSDADILEISQNEITE